MLLTAYRRYYHVRLIGVLGRVKITPVKLTYLSCILDRNVLGRYTTIRGGDVAQTIRAMLVYLVIRPARRIKEGWEPLTVLCL
jgi:hypothetical protein